MSIIYVENAFSKRQWSDMEFMIQDLLTPYQDSGSGELEFMREQTQHMKECLARFIAHSNPNTNTLEQIFNVDIELKQIED